MAAQSIASRPRRSQESEPDDIVLARALQITEWAKRHIAIVIVAGVVVFLTVGGLFWYRTDQTRRIENAAIDFLQVEQSIYTGNDAVVVRDLQMYIAQHGGTTYGEEARILLGQVHLTNGRPAEAIEVVQPVASRITRSPVGPQAAMLLASAQEAAGQPNEAIQTYLRVADGSDAEYRRTEALVSAAILRAQIDDHAGAAELYRRILAGMDPAAVNRAFFEMRLAEAEALAAQR